MITASTTPPDPTSRPPALVATDLDGTLVRSDGTLSDYTRSVLDRLDERGVPVIFVTGRPLRWIEDLFTYVGSHGLAIASNGAVVWDVAGSAPLLERTIAPELALEVARDLRTAMPDLAFAIETSTGWMSEPGYEGHDAAQGADRVRDGEAALEELLDRPLLKLLALDRSRDPDDLLAAGQQAIGDRLTVTHSNFPLLEVSAAGVTKASTLQLVAERLGVAASEVIAFGDMPNDLAMLGWAGRSYAMAGAHPDVRAQATDVAGSADDDGVARVLAGVFGL